MHKRQRPSRYRQHSEYTITNTRFRTVSGRDTSTTTHTGYGRHRMGSYGRQLQRHTRPLAPGNERQKWGDKRECRIHITACMSSNSSSQSSSEEAQPLPHSEKFWDVQAILAERHSSFQTGSEVLVAWKPSWIPIENVPEGPILSSFRDAPKARFQSSVGKLILPVEPDTALADDVAAAADWSARQILQHREQFQGASGGSAARQRERGTPRKSLGCVAKRMTTHKTKNQ